MKILLKMADYRQANSLAAKKRRIRFQLFKSLIAALPKPLTILDVGGTETFWKAMEFTAEKDVKITLLNVFKTRPSLPNFASVSGDAADMSEFRDDEFDVVFSNSVIEHLAEYSNQVKMAKEIKRVGKRYFVQTPNKFFPIEPHFLFPFFQFLPQRVRVFLLRHFDIGWSKKNKHRREAEKEIKSIRLLTEKEFTYMFSGATLYKEKMFVFTKSFVAYNVWTRETRPKV